MSKHTPGPWAIEKCPKAQAVTDGRDWPWLVNYNDGDYEGYVALVQTQNAEANARLIAAAPDMLAALEEITDAFTDAMQYHGIPLNRHEADAVVRAEYAIQKARGEE